MSRAFDRVDSVDHRLAHEYHSGSAAERAIVDFAVGVLGVVAKLVGVQFDEAGGLRAAEDASRQVRLDDLGEQGYDVDPHRRNQ